MVNTGFLLTIIIYTSSTEKEKFVDLLSSCVNYFCKEMNGNQCGKFLFVFLNKNRMLSYAPTEFHKLRALGPLFFLELNFIIKETISLGLK